jgi:hypothetical protein
VVAGLASVRRALRVLEVVADAGDGITAKSVARRLDDNLSTTYHLLTSLVDDGDLVRLEPARGFGLGPKLPALNDRLRAQLPIPPGLGATLRRVGAVAVAVPVVPGRRSRQPARAPRPARARSAGRRRARVDDVRGRPGRAGSGFRWAGRRMTGGPRHGELCPCPHARRLRSAPTTSAASCARRPC